MKQQMHNPSFHWKDQSLCDGNDVVARLVHDPTNGRRNISLAAVRLAPGGPPLLHWTLSWHYGLFASTNRLRTLDLESSSPDRIGLRIVADSAEDEFSSETRLLLSYDPDRGCYRFEVATELEANRFPFASWKEIDSPAYHRKLALFPAEFANFLPLESYCFHAPFDSIAKRWQAFVYQGACGAWRRVPQHHLNTPDKYHLQFQPDRPRMGFVDDAAGNPCIELLGSSPSAVKGGICWCMNDLHLAVAHYDLNFHHRVRYALYQFTPEETALVERKAVGRTYSAEEIEWHDRPRFTEHWRCDFEHGFDLSQHDDCFQYWLPFGEVRHTQWSRKDGRTGGRCLHSATPSPGRVFWQAEGSNAPVVAKGASYRVSVWAKTKQLAGEARIEAWDTAKTDAVIASNPLRACSDWTELAVEVELKDDGAPLPGRLAVRLLHDGAGESWFDDVEIHAIDQARGKK